MKIRVHFKDPNGPYDSFKQAIRGLPKEEADKVEEAFHKWVRAGEYLSIEVDTEADTATVVRNP